MARIDIDWIKKQLDERGITQREFGEAAGIPGGQQAYSKVFSGRRRLQQDEILPAVEFLRRKGIVPTPPGLAEASLTPWQPQTDGERATVALLARGTRATVHWSLDRPATAFALLAGDIVVCADGEESADGSLVAARRVDPETGDFAVTFIARRVGPYLWTGDTDGAAALLPIDAQYVSLIGPVLGVLRRL